MAVIPLKTRVNLHLVDCKKTVKNGIHHPEENS